ncbi:ATPase [Fervidicella metallireducens AeB]|uniref:ATPase n=1 Tax=Fervidicella metallireducens AeB TaxID=1403537 RepID=A0A017RZI5_9CLOT|nr:ATP cone domain-containing protein [Fervidicella metallireducens]EYE89355.1 ATPase [Fervidicella metallireducens AeB]
MQVIKRDGRLQDFDLDKIIRSIGAASDDVDEPMNSSDLHNIAKNIKDEIQATGKDKIDYSEIRQLVVNKLKEYGFKDIAEAYCRV